MKAKRCFWVLSTLIIVTLQASAQLKSTLYAQGFSLPIAFVQDPTSPTRQFVVQQRGLIKCVVNGVVQGTNAINLTATVSSAGSEKGLLGMTFDPNYASNGIAYINYTTGNVSTSTTSWISKITRNAIDPKIFDAGSLNPILTLAQPFQNHNGGTISFGPDGYLYIGLGDGGSAGDPSDRAQNLTNLLGKMLRIDPSTDSFPGDPNKDYSIPPGQPFSGTWGTLGPEIWAIGLRNPWKWTFDPQIWLGTGGLWIGDVGQDNWEEISFSPLNASARNYGWRRKEGYAFFTNTSGPNTNYQDPIWVYDHAEGIAVTGGYVYRGTKLGDIFGRYFYADYGTSRIWSLIPTYHATTGEALNAAPGDNSEHTTDLGVMASGISSIDVDSNGEMYYIDYGAGRVYRIDPEDRAWATDFSTSQAVVNQGQLRSLSSVDDKLLSYRATFGQDVLDGDAGVFRVGFTHNKATVGTIQVKLVVRTNQPAGANGRIAIRNWITKRLEVIHNFSQTTTFQTINSPAVGSANFIRAGDNRIEIAVLGNAQLMLIDPVITTVEQVKVTVN
jgi:glucose/arabinose dehydrogenase